MSRFARNFVQLTSHESQLVSCFVSIYSCLTKLRVCIKLFPPWVLPMHSIAATMGYVSNKSCQINIPELNTFNNKCWLRFGQVCRMVNTISCYSFWTKEYFLCKAYCAAITQYYCFPNFQITTVGHMFPSDIQIQEVLGNSAPILPLVQIVCNHSLQINFI